MLTGVKPITRVYDSLTHRPIYKQSADHISHICYNMLHKCVMFVTICYMKMIRIDDRLHELLKREAKAEGRTLQWVIENKLFIATNVYTDPVKIKSVPEERYVQDSQEWGETPSTGPTVDKPTLTDLMNSGAIKRGI